jgi:hypothetical protein
MLDPHTLVALHQPFDAARKSGEWPYRSKRVCWHTLSDAGEATGLNMGVMFDVDGTDVWQLTEAEIEGRQQVMRAIAVLRKYAPGFENCKLRTSAVSVGIRETRRILGEQIITKDEIINEARFEETVGIFPVFYDGLGTIILPENGAYFQVPYGILVPRSVENLLVAGRCVSGSRDAVPTTRQMMFCSLTGQAAGIAAALSIRDSCAPRQIDVGRLQGAIRKQGVRIE